MNRKRGRSVISISLISITAMVLSWVPASVYASEPNTSKEEVVYINLNGDGSTRETIVVNIFDLEGDGRIVDYGPYQSTRNMTTTDDIDQSDDMLVIDTTAEKIYYEGTLDDCDIPWNISIHYYMDGQEYTAEEMAGKSGALKITFTIEENTDCQGSFFDDYTLQISLNLDTKKCGNIAAEGATLANVGSYKQLAYTVLPGKGGDYTITADVTDFEMDGFSINGILLRLDIQVADDELMEQITELIDAIEQLDDGAHELYDGVSDMRSAVQSDLHAGIHDLNTGALQLYNGTGSLMDGSSNLQSGAAALRNGAISLDSGIQSLHQGIVSIQAALNALNQKSPALTEGSAAFQSALNQLQSSLNGLSVTNEDLSKLRDASAAIKNGVDKLVTDATTLQQSVSFEAYKTAMSAYGLDIDTLKSNNATAISDLQTMIDDMNDQVLIMQGNGIDTTVLEAQINLLPNMIALLDANNASITGTENYLTSVNQNLAAFKIGLETLQASYESFHTEIINLANLLGNLTGQIGTLTSAVKGLALEYEKLDGGISEYTGAVGQITAGFTQIAYGAQQFVSGSDALITGAEGLYGGTVNLLSGVVDIYNGAGSLKDGTGTLDAGVAELLTAVAQLYDGTGEMKEGTTTLRQETDEMDAEIADKISDLLKSISGGDVEISSFVSSKNENVKSVQFVIQTERIKVAKTQVAAEDAPEDLNFFQKLLKLFGT